MSDVDRVLAGRGQRLAEPERALVDVEANPVWIGGHPAAVFASGRHRRGCAAELISQSLIDERRGKLVAIRDPIYGLAGPVELAEYLGRHVPTTKHRFAERTERVEHDVW